MIRKFFYFFIITLSLLPNILFAEIGFTEIMYNPDGADSGYEWVEIKNLSETKNEDLKNWKFCEGNPKTTCHTLKIEDNQNFLLEANSFGIITDNRVKFLEQNSFTGLVLQSTGFSLLNTTGEKIELKNSDGVIVAGVKYNPDSGGADGNTLCLIGDIWKDCENTAGKINKIASNNGNNGNVESIVIPNTYMEFTDVVNGKKRIKAEIDEFSTAIAGARSSFSGRAYGLTDNEIYEAEYFWTMGDGSKEYGKNIFHEYSFPGEYIISLTVKVGHFTGTHKRKIKVISPLIEFSDVDFNKNVIGILNKSNDILNLGDWIIMVDGEKFIIPEDTYIQNKGKILFSNKIMGFRDFDKNSKIFLLFPNNKKFLKYEEKASENNEKVKKDIKTTRKKKTLTVEVVKLKPNIDLEVVGIEAQSVSLLDKDHKQKKSSKKQITKNDFKQEASIVSAFDKKSIGNIKNIVLSKKNIFKTNSFYILFLFLLTFLVIGIFIIRKKTGIDNTENKTDKKIDDLVEKIDIEEV